MSMIGRIEFLNNQYEPIHHYEILSPIFDPVSTPLHP